MHRNRVITAFIFLPLFVLLIKFLPAWVFISLVLAGVLIGQTEFYRMCLPTGRGGLMGIGLAAGALVWAGMVFGNSGTTLGVMAVSFLLFWVVYLRVYKDIQSALPEGAMGLLGIFYVAWLLSHLVLIRQLSMGENLIILLFLITWAGDAGAYYFGKGLGKHPLAPKISPNKTIEGAVGGLLVSFAAAWFGTVYLFPSLSGLDVLVIGAIGGILGPLGDLTESLFKRSAGVKDSGALVPAHGGLLDKVDSLLFTAPALYYYLVWVKGLGPVILV